MNTIDIDPQGNATVFGDVAHKFYDCGQRPFPRTPRGTNRFFVYGPCGRLFAAQSTLEGALNYMTGERVLVSIP